MKEQLQDKLVEILTSIQGTIGKANDFAGEQLPEIAQSYMIYGRIGETVSLLIAAAGLFAVVWMTVRTYRLALRPEGVFDDMPPPLAFLFGGLLGMLPFMYFIDKIQTFLLVWFAPKVWLLKEIATILK